VSSSLLEGSPSSTLSVFLPAGLLTSSLALGTSNGDLVEQKEFCVTAGSGAFSRIYGKQADLRPLMPVAEPRRDVPTQPDTNSIRWLRENSGLTWDQLGRLFGVSRRTVHLWANGSRMNASNAEALAQAVHMVRNINAPTGDACRASLFAQDSDGLNPFEEFITKRQKARELINAPAFHAADMLDSIAGDGVDGD